MFPLSFHPLVRIPSALSSSPSHSSSSSSSSSPPSSPSPLPPSLPRCWGWRSSGRSPFALGSERMGIESLKSRDANESNALVANSHFHRRVLHHIRIHILDNLSVSQRWHPRMSPSRSLPGGVGSGKGNGWEGCSTRQNVYSRICPAPLQHIFFFIHSPLLRGEVPRTLRRHVLSCDCRTVVLICSHQRRRLDASRDFWQHLRIPSLRTFV